MLHFLVLIVVYLHMDKLVQGKLTLCLAKVLKNVPLQSNQINKAYNLELFLLYLMKSNHNLKTLPTNQLYMQSKVVT